MTGSDSQLPSLKERLVAELKRDSKRVAVLGVLMVVLVALAGREALRQTRPSTARAAAARLAPARPAGDKTLPPGARQTPDTEAKVDLGLHRLTVDRDLFTPDPVYFPSRHTASAPKIKVVDPAAKIEAAKRAVRAQAHALTLQSTVVGATPTAIVNGQVLRAGDWINGFKVVAITTRSCTMEKDGTRVTLEMSK